MKNLFKKLLASCLVVCMVLTLCVGAITVNAENPTGTVVAGTTTVDSGEGTAVVPVEVSAGVAASKVSVKVPANLTITALTLDTADEDVDVTYASAADPNGKPISLVEATEFVAPYVDAEGVFSYIIHAPAGEVTTAPVTVKISFTGTFVENAEGILVDVEAQAAPDAVVLFDLTVTDGKIIVKAAHVCAAARTEQENVNQATCYAEGSYDEVVYCSCGKELSRTPKTIDKIAHTEEEIPAVPATCTTAGATAGVKCSVCQEVLTAPTATEALGHAWDEGVIDPDATCTKEGVITYTCTRCPETKTEVINVKDHTPAAETVKKDEVAATCTTDGSYRDVVVCEVCGAEISSETITVKALGHNFGDNLEFCANNCGTENPDYVAPCEHTNTELKYDVVDGNCVTTKVCLDCDDYSEVIYSAASVNIEKGLNLAEGLATIFRVKVADVVGTNPFAVINHDLYSDDTTISGVSADVVYENVEPSTGKTPKYAYTYRGLAAKEMLSEMHVRVYATDAQGNVVLIGVLDFVLADGLKGYLTKTDIRQVNLGADILRYGAESQKAYTYRPNVLPTDGVDPSCFSELPTTFTNTTVTQNPANKAELERAVVLENTIMLRFRLNTISGISAEDLHYTVSYINTTGEATTVPGIVGYNINGKKYEFTFESLPVAVINDYYTITLWHGEDIISSQEFSFESYAATQYSSNGNRKDLAQAICAYSASAAALYKTY